MRDIGITLWQRPSSFSLPNRIEPRDSNDGKLSPPSDRNDSLKVLFFVAVVKLV